VLVRPFAASQAASATPSARPATGRFRLFRSRRSDIINRILIGIQAEADGMRRFRFWQNTSLSDVSLLALLAIAKVLLHTFTNGQYGFHRDELATLDDARYLDWGYVAYPPLTPFLGRVALGLFGPSLAGVRFFAALASGAAVLLAGMTAREMGGQRRAALVAALAVAVSPMSFASGALLQYVSFDYLWWVLAGYFAVRLLKSQDPRWWLGIGIAAGSGFETKYTMAFLAAGIAGGLLLTDARRDLRNPWLWCSVALSALIFLPNLIWQIRHDFVSLEFLKSIHARDMRAGRTAGFLTGQLWKCANPATIPLWLAGLYSLFTPRMKQYRMLGWMFVIPCLLLVVARGRDYYLAPAYAMLLAAGAVWWEQWLASLPAARARIAARTTWRALAVSGVLVAVVVLRFAPINSQWWKVADRLNDNWNEEIGWPELVETVAGVRNSLPPEERSRTGILAGDSGHAGAINLLGPANGLPRAMSGMNSHWLRGYGDPPPSTVIVIGMKREDLNGIFESCEPAGRVTNRYGIRNSTIADYDGIFVCRRLRKPWPEFWKHFRYYG